MAENKAMANDSEIELRYRFRAQAQGRHTSRMFKLDFISWIFGFATFLLVSVFAYLHFMQIGGVADLLKAEPWLWVMFATAPCLTTAICIISILCKATLEEMGAFASMIIDIPAGVEQGIYQFIGGNAKDFEVVRGQLSLGRELSQIEDRLGKAFLESCDATRRALSVLNPNVGLRGIVNQYHHSLALGQLLQKYLDERGNIITAHEMIESTARLEALAQQLAIITDPPANQIAAE